MTWKRLAAALAIVCIPLLAAAGNSGRICNSGVCFVRETEVSGNTLSVRDIGTYRAWGFRVYTTTLYIPSGVEGIDEVLSANTPRKLVLHYHRSITADDLAESTEEFASRNPRNDMAALRERLDKLYDAYKDVGSGDEYAISYTPNEGTTIELNDEKIISIEGGDFARAFFGIWLGEEPISSGIRDRLVGG